MDAKEWAYYIRTEAIGNGKVTFFSGAFDLADAIDALLAERDQLQAEVEALKNKTTGDY